MDIITDIAGMIPAREKAISNLMGALPSNVTTNVGDKVWVLWDNGNVDEGIPLPLPGLDPLEGDVFIYFPKPSGGTDVMPVWIHYYDLVSNPNILDISNECM